MGRVGLAGFLGGAVDFFTGFLSRITHAITAQGPCCRFHPTCSNYAAAAFRHHGIFKGLYLSLHRIARCNPLGGSGFDPVPKSLGE